MCALHMLSSLRAEIGSLDHVTSILKVFGMVDVEPAFGDLASVLDGCTEQLAEIFGEDVGIPARVEVGVAALPGRRNEEVVQRGRRHRRIVAEAPDDRMFTGAAADARRVATAQPRPAG